MAAVTAINLSVDSFETSAGPKTALGESPAGHMESCRLRAAFTGTYVQGTGFTISNAQIQAAIATVKRDGATAVILDVASDAPGQEGTTSAFVVAGPVTYAAIGNAVTGLLYGSDLATEHAAAVMGVFQSPLTFFVSFSSLGVA